MTRGQPGRSCNLTADQIKQVRDVHARWLSVRAERMRLQYDLGLKTEMFCKIGRGECGKKPKREVA
jgi:hypothetical protein